MILIDQINILHDIYRATDIEISDVIVVYAIYTRVYTTMHYGNLSNYFVTI